MARRRAAGSDSLVDVMGQAMIAEAVRGQPLILDAASGSSMRLPCLSLAFVPALALTLAAQDLPPQPKSGAKVCVAIVGNASSTSAFVERMTERLTKSLKQDKVNSVAMESRTTEKYPLELSSDNGDESKLKECDYVVLSLIRDPRQHPTEPQPPQISIGGRVPSVDASDSWSKGPVSRENMEVAIAVFRIGRFKPVLDTYILERPASSVSDTLFQAMDHEANRVQQELKKH
jgi:hypothetical protein